MKKLLASLAGLGLAVTPLAIAPPAQAGTVCNVTRVICGQVDHYAPDHGYDVPIKVRSWNSKTVYLIHEGQSSRKKHRDVDQVWAGAGEALYRVRWDSLGRPYKTKWFVGPGWRKINDATHLVLVVERA